MANELEHFNLTIVIILTVGFGFAILLGYVSDRLKLSPILGYLLAGYLIGPYSPGFVADLNIAEQLAEIGVILMMFSVGLHFKWQDLIKHKNISIPGAVIQTSIATIAGAVLAYIVGWRLEAGILFGLAIGVASTVVLVRVLADNDLLNTTAGHISVGWLIVEDIITVAVLLLVPAIAFSLKGESVEISSLAFSFGSALLKFGILALVMFTIGRKFVSYILSKVELTNSHELFTLAILSITFLIAVGAAHLLGTSIALGAFLAGMVIHQTDVQLKVSNHTRPLKDTFVVIFFLSVGMLFNPKAIEEHLLLFSCTLLIILVLKLLSAFVIAIIFKHRFKTALIVSLALAQIGEFSFILAEQAMSLDILPEAGYDIIVACSLVSIAINPVLFRWLGTFEPTSTDKAIS